eukprot:10653061-Prorocentrum_lima.AAC.1
MTSSLVGSEMCIRDRWLAVVGCGWLWLVVVGCGWLWLAGLAMVDGCGWVCLLYTSDAADDM